jgi:hypothetical protein
MTITEDGSIKETFKGVDVHVGPKSKSKAKASSNKSKVKSQSKAEPNVTSVKFIYAKLSDGVYVFIGEQMYKFKPRDGQLESKPGAILIGSENVYFLTRGTYIERLAFGTSTPNEQNFEKIDKKIRAKPIPKYGEYPVRTLSLAIAIATAAVAVGAFGRSG